MTAKGTLAQALENLPKGQPVTLGALLSATGSRAHGVALLLLSLPEALPIPVPSAAAFLGVPLVAISAHLAVFGEAATLPRWLRRQVLPHRLVGVLRSRVAPVLGRAERMSHLRWAPLAGQERLLGLACLYLSVLLLLPLPFFNVPPALCLVLLAWGMVQRDGTAVAAGLAGTLALTAVLFGVIQWVGNLAG